MVRVKRRASAKHDVEDDAERPDVALLRVRAAQDFRGHVEGRDLKSAFTGICDGRTGVPVYPLRYTGSILT